MKRKRKDSLPSRKTIGVIAEDDSDVKVIDVLIGKIAKRPYNIRSFAAGGCGKIVAKCRAWAESLRVQGCRYLLLIHDLDSAVLPALRAQIANALDRSPIDIYLIVIPVREIEAWLLADHEAITKSMKLTIPLNHVANPESRQNPKEYLARMIYVKSRHTRRYVNAIHNAQIAKACSPSKLERCQSFVPFKKFIREHI